MTLTRHGCRSGVQAAAELERLAGLQRFIGTDRLHQVLRDTGRRNRSHYRLTYEVMLWVVLAIGILTDLPRRDVYRHAARLPTGRRLPGRAGLCRARQRLGVGPVQPLSHQVVGRWHLPTIPAAPVGAAGMVGIDGTVLDVPASPADARGFGRPRGVRGDGAFPQVRQLSLVERETHAELALVLKPCRRGESCMVGGCDMPPRSNCFELIPGRGNTAIPPFPYRVLNDSKIHTLEDWVSLEVFSGETS